MAYQLFRETFREDAVADQNGNVHWAQFLDYYEDFSSLLDDDNLCEMAMRRQWRIPQGFGGRRWVRFAEQATARQLESSGEARGFSDEPMA